MPAQSLTIEPQGQGFHPDWEILWKEDGLDADLKADIFSDPRQMDQLLPAISRFDQYERTLAKATRNYKEIVKTYSSDDDLTEIGLAWCAPSLFRRLFDKATREIFGTLTPDQIAIVHQYRAHAAPDELPELQTAMDLPLEGRKCILSWLSLQPVLAAERLVLQLPRSDFEDLDAKIQRSKLFEDYLRAHEDNGVEYV